MLSSKIKHLGGGLYEVQLFKDNVHHHTIDAMFTEKQAKAICFHLEYMHDRLNYLEPLQKKFEENQC